MAKRSSAVIDAPVVAVEGAATAETTLATRDESALAARTSEVDRLVELAVEGGAAVETLRELLDLRRQARADAARDAYTEAMAQFRAKCPPILKTRVVDFTSSKGRTNYRHAGLSESIEQVKAIMGECGLSHSWRTEQPNGMVTVTCIVTHAFGHSESTSLSAPVDLSGNKNPIQAIGSTVTYLQRYTLFSLLGLAAQEEDDDGNGACGDGKITTEQQTEIEMLLKETKSNRKKFLAWAKVDGVEDIPVTRYDMIVATLRRKIA
jgi:hypothetical protein